MYGLTERNYDAIRGAQLVTNPGCYPTAALLALEPLAEAGLLAGEIVIDAKSGISGAGKKPSDRTHFSENHGSVSAYGVFGHRHQPEIEQELGAAVTFVPHLVPLDRGILETIYARVRPGTTARDVADVMDAAYEDAPFVRLTGEALPEIKHAAYTNFCDIGWRVDAAGGRILLVSVIDNLVKGAAGQAIQNMNVDARLRRAGGAAALSRYDKPDLAPVVLKFGGELLEDPQRVAALASTIASAEPRKTPLVIVHGGGREIDASLARAGIEKRQVDGLRITDEPTLDVVVGVLAGLVNTRFVAALGAAGVPAVGLTGADAGVGRVKAAPPHLSTSGATVDLGRVGEPVGKESRRC